MELHYLAAEARLTLPETLSLLDISRTTWRRWNDSGPPSWAIQLLRHRAGYLDALGWRQWQIRGGLLYCNDLHYSENWAPGELIAQRFKELNRSPLGRRAGFEKRTRPAAGSL